MTILAIAADDRNDHRVHNLDTSTWLQCVGDLTQKIDRQQAIAQTRSVDPDMVGKLEPVLEWTAGDAPMR